MKNVKRLLLVLLSACIMLSSFFVPKLFVNADVETQILVANSANRVDNSPDDTRADYWNDFCISGGSATAWLWTTFNDNPAVFCFNLADTANSFEPVFVGENYVGTFKIYGSKDNVNWSVVAEMTSTYINGAVYNSTNGIAFGDPSSQKTTEARAYSVLNQANIDLILADNATKTVYLKVGDIVSESPDEWGSRIQLRYFGITYDVPVVVTQEPPVIDTDEIFVANSANRVDNSPDDTRADYWNDFCISGGGSTAWLWTTFNDNPAVFQFNLADTTTTFEPVFVGEDYVGTFKIYGSKDNVNWSVVAEMTSTYTNGAVYNSTNGIAFGDPSSPKTTEARAFSILNQANIDLILADNATKTVYLKVGDIVSATPDQYGSRIQLRYFGITSNSDDYVAPPVVDEIFVANSANRVDNSPDDTRADYWNDFCISGGGSTAWLWTTFNDNPAVFQFNLADTTTTFEPVFVGEDYVGTFKIYGSKDNVNWSIVAEMTSTYTNGAVYNSTNGMSFGDPSSPKTTEARAFSILNQANIDLILADNATKTVYLKVGDIVSATPDQYGSRIQLRYFGITSNSDDNGVPTITPEPTQVPVPSITPEPTQPPVADDDTILVANSANRADNGPVEARSDYWNNFCISGGSATAWLWTTFNDSPAIFRFDLADTAYDFEPLFVGEDYVGTFKIYGSKDNITWSVVAEMTSTYTNGAVYNSTNGIAFGDPTSPKTTEARAFSVINQANIDLILADNATKTVYLKVGDIVSDTPDQYGSRIQLRYFGITYNSTAAPEDPYNHSIKVADSANRVDFTPVDTKSDYWNNYHISGGVADPDKGWLWDTLTDNPAIFRFDLPDTSVAFEPYFEGEETVQPFKIYASKNQLEWVVVAEITDTYTMNRIYNSTTGLGTGDYAVGEKMTAGRAYSVLNESNIALLMSTNPSKVVYLKVGDITGKIQLRSFGLTYDFTGEDVPGQGDDYTPPVIEDITFPDPYDGNENYKIKNEFRIAVAGQTFDEAADGFPTFFEGDLAEGSLQGAIVDGNRLLLGGENNVFNIEVDPDAVFIKLDYWDSTSIEGADGSVLFNISLYSNEAEDFQSICDGSGLDTASFLPPRFRWNLFDNTWGRSGNNEYIVTNAGINAETGKKMLQIRLMGRFNNAYDGHLAYKSFVVQTVVPVTSGEVSSNASSNVSDVNSDGDDSPQTSDSSTSVMFLMLLLGTAAFVITLKNRRSLKE